MRIVGGLVLVLALLLPASAALAVPPGNDNFADAESLGIGLPVDITRSNVGATRESLEPNHGFAASQETVWFEWEADVTGFVTVSVCDSDLKAIVVVYTGDALGSLMKAADGNGSEGPDCMFSQAEYSFEATEGSLYKIVVAGDGFHFPDQPRPVTAGDFSLQLEATPPPANDDFQDAATLQGDITEEPGGDRFYFASAPGYNWMATKEPGEQDHGSVPGGASVWYSWTAPESGDASVSACCGSQKSIGLYQGGSVTSLTPVEPDPAYDWIYPVTGGTTYRIAVDGRFDPGAGSVGMSSFDLMLTMELTPNPPEIFEFAPPAATVARDTTPPATTVSKRMLKREPPVVVVSFGSNEPGSTFRCKLDKRAFTGCRSPKRLKNLTSGRHTFRVVATDAAGNADPTPAKVSFRIPGPKPSPGPHRSR